MLLDKLVYGIRFKKPILQWVESAHPNLGKPGVFWHTQGGSKSYSMACFSDTEKARPESQ